MHKTLLVIVLSLITSACAIQPVPLQDRALESFKIPFHTLIVDDLSTEAKYGVNDVVYVNGWAPAHAGFTPPINKAFVSKVKNSLITNKSSGRVDISVLRVGYFIEKNVADDVVFVGIFMAGRDRGIKCDADINFKTENESRRITLTHEIRRSYFDNQEEVRMFIETCQTELIKQLASSISNPT